jgi:hypothetical protein
MISNDQIELNVCRAYIEHVRARFPAGVYYADRYLLILQIREWQLRRRLLKLPATLTTRETLLTGHRSAEKFLLDIDVGEDKKLIAEIEDILQSIAVEFFAEIQQIEHQHPEMAAEFAREKEEYRLMWNDYVTDTLEGRTS